MLFVAFGKQSQHCSLCSDALIGSLAQTFGSVSEHYSEI